MWRTLIYNRLILVFLFQIATLSSFSQTLKYKRIASTDTSAFLSKSTLYPYSGGYNCLSESYVINDSLCLNWIKLDNNFEVITQKVLKPDFQFHTNNTRDLVTGTVADTDGFMFGGAMLKEAPPYYHPYLLRTDTNLNPVWSFRFENLPGYFSTLPGLFSESGNFTAYYSTTIPYESVLQVKGTTASSTGISAFKIKSNPTEYYMVNCSAKSGTYGEHFLGGSINILQAALLMKTDINGINFCKQINLQNNFDLTTTVIKPVSNGDILVGMENEYGFGEAAYVSRFSSAGQPIWCKRLNIFNTQIRPLQILETTQNEILVVASTLLSFKPLLLKFSATGNLEWARSYGPDLLRDVNQLMETSPGIFTMIVPAGGLRIIEFDGQGNGCSLEPAQNLVVDDVTLSVTDYPMTVEPFTVSLQNLQMLNVAAQFETNDICVVNSVSDYNQNQQNLRIFPQPAKSYIKIELPKKFFAGKNTQILIYNINGILMEKWPFAEELTLKDLPNGSYIIEIAEGEKSIRKLLIKAE